MASFSIQWRNSTRKDLRKLPPAEVKRIVTEVELLTEEPFPHGSEKLAGSDHTYRIRVGDYRVVYEVFVPSKTVEIQRVRHRKESSKPRESSNRFVHFPVNPNGAVSVGKTGGERGRRDALPYSALNRSRLEPV